MALVKQLIDRFEWPYGMELLATVHWIVTHQPEAAESVYAAVNAVRQWNERKSAWPERDIRIAWERLKKLGWFGRSAETVAVTSGAPLARTDETRQAPA